MAPLPEQLYLGIRVWLYEWELQRLWQSFEAASSALAYQRGQLERQMEERYAARTPDDDLDALDDLDWRAEELSGNELPALYVIGMYHTFERHAAKWMKRTGEQVTFDEIARWFVSNGYDMDPSAAAAVALAANCAKHGAGKSAKRLFKLRSDWFRDGTTPDTADDSRLEVTPKRLEEMFETLLRTVPRGLPTPV